MRLVAAVSLAFLMGMAATQTIQEDLTVIESWILHSDADNALYHHFLSQAFERLDAREREIATIESASEWRARQDYVRRAIAAEELRITGTGQVASSPAGETVFSLNRSEANAMTEQARADVVDAAARLSGFLPPADTDVEQEHYPAEWVHAAVPGALAAYDLPDLAATLMAPPDFLDIDDALTVWLAGRH